MLFVSGFSWAYLLVSGASLVMVMIAATSAYKVQRRWGGELLPEERYQLEKQVYLVITLMGLGLFLRLFLVPLWFITFARLMPTIPGAMCLISVHLTSPLLGFSATALKFVLPLFYGYWLILNYLDRRVETHPFMHAKLVFLGPVFALMTLESFIDTRFLMRFEPKSTSCCTSIFDVPRPGVPEWLSWDGWGFVIGFYICLAVLVIVCWQKHYKPPGYVMWLLTILTPISFLLALHTKISPLFLNAPFHHCVFCLWQHNPDSIISTGLVVGGSWLMACYLAIISLKNYPPIKVQLEGFLQRMLRYALGMLVAGGVLLVVHLVVV